MRRTALTALLATGALALGAASAQASSIVFIRDNNVWVASPDGVKQHQVTKDGTAASPYQSPSQDDSGVIVALKDKRFFRMDQGGNLKNPPVESASPFGTLRPRVSPDGTKIAYEFITVTGCGRGCYSLPGGTMYSYSDRFTPDSTFGRQDSVREPAWIDNSRLVSAWSTEIDLMTVGAGPNSYSKWYDDEGQGVPPENWRNRHFPAVARTGDRIASVRTDNPDAAASELVLDRINSIAPGSVPAHACQFDEERITDPSWSVDGTQLAFEANDGINVFNVPGSVTDCGSITGRAVFRGTEPFFGPADVNPPPPPPADPGPVPVPGDSLSASFTPPSGKALKLRTALKKGLAVQVTCNRPCGVDASAAYKRKPVGKGSLVIGAGKTSGVLKVKFTKKGKKSLARAKKAQLTLSLTTLDGSGGEKKQSMKVNLKR
jgi:hypothetical protein